MIPCPIRRDGARSGRGFRAVTILIAAWFGLVAQAPAGSLSVGGSPFRAGQWRGSFSAGSAQSADDTTVVAGLGIGYFFANGWEAGLDGEAWIGSSPNIYKITPGLRYVYSGFERFSPYLGAFYRRTIYHGLTDLYSYGGRYGVFMALGGNAYAGLGGVYERLNGCDDAVYDSCQSSYPEITVSMSF